MHNRVILIALSVAAALMPAWRAKACGSPAGTDSKPTELLLPSLRTLQVSPSQDPWGVPVVNLAVADDVVNISFDELADEPRYLRYSLEHRDGLWREEGVVDPEYMDSFNEERVEDWAHSQATVVPYINYRLNAPGPGMRLKEPGNYLVKIWDEDDPDTPLAMVGIGVCDYTVPVAVEVSPVTDIDARGAHQQLTVRLDTRLLDLTDPLTELKVVVTQNGRPETSRVLTVPSRRVGSELIYDHQRELIFPAGNEYRRFDLASVNFPGRGVEIVSHDAPAYNAWLLTDSPRAKSPYFYDRTQHGRYIVRTVEAEDDSDIRADYVLTHFTLEMPPLTGADIYIEGDLTGRRADPLSRMVYNYDEGRYEQSILLKQGAYNYQYLAVPHGVSGVSLTAPVEGDKWETVNEYTVSVYHRPRGSRLDRLVGHTSTTSFNGNN